MHQQSFAEAVMIVLFDFLEEPESRMVWTLMVHDDAVSNT